MVMLVCFKRLFSVALSNYLAKQVNCPIYGVYKVDHKLQGCYHQLSICWKKISCICYWVNVLQGHRKLL